ncbi:MAG: T9SS type A sorting domain-containing protein, partial [Flavisolibacter sp.]
IFHRDLQLLSIKQPASVLCSGSITPSVIVKNPGMETINSFKVSYSLDNGVAQTITVNNALPVNAQTVINFPSVTISGTGNHTIKYFTWDPVSVSGIGDNYTYNDTISRSFSLAGTMNAPMTESFESGFPPANWTIINPDASITWNRYANGNGNSGAAYLNTYNYLSTDQIDDLVSPMINFSGVDSVTLSFDVSAVTYSYPGTTGIALDTLEVLLTKDCGATFTTIYKKWGEDLQTVHDPNNPQTAQYFPSFPDQWRKEIVDLTGFGGQGPMMLFFRTTNNNENNIFIDNVNLTTRILPDKIKQQGYLVLPSPFQNSFGVWHVQQPTSLKYISVYNSIGQLIWSKQFNGNAQKMEMVDLAGKSAGVYVVRLGYDDKNKNVSERIVKIN